MKPIRQAARALSFAATLLTAGAAANAWAVDPVPITVSPVNALTVAQTFRAPAEVVSLNESQISTETPGVVEVVAADEGEVAEAGDLLVSLDTTDLELVKKRIQADVTSTSARIEQAKLRLRRARDLSKNRFVSADELLDRETDLSVLTAEHRRQELQLESARRDIEKARIRAPFRGVVTERLAQLGSYLRHGDPVAVLVDIERFELEARIPSRYASHFNNGIKAQFVAAGREWPVRINRFFPITEDDERVNRARFGFAAESPPIGTSGELQWRSQRNMLPADLLVRREERLGVFVIQDERARFVALPAAQEGRPSPHDLAPGTLLAINGRERLHDEMPVRITN